MPEDLVSGRIYSLRARRIEERCERRAIYAATRKNAVVLWNLLMPRDWQRETDL